MYQTLAHVPRFGSILQPLLKLSALRRSSLMFGGCFYDLTHLEGEFQERYVEPLIAENARMEDAMRFLRCMNFVRLDEFKRLHRELTMPTLFIWGADDPTFPEPKAREMAGQFPNVAGFHTVAHAKLFFYEEQPGEVARLIERFVSDTPRQQETGKPA